MNDPYPLPPYIKLIAIVIDNFNALRKTACLWDQQIQAYLHVYFSLEFSYLKVENMVHGMKQPVFIT